MNNLIKRTALALAGLGLSAGFVVLLPATSATAADGDCAAEAEAVAALVLEVEKAQQQVIKVGAKGPKGKAIGKTTGKTTGKTAGKTKGKHTFARPGAKPVKPAKPVQSKATNSLAVKQARLAAAVVALEACEAALEEEPAV